MAIQSLSNEVLLNKIKNLTGKEQLILSEVLRYLREIDHRKLYLERGYESLFSFCVKELGYEESRACRRIAACRLIRDLPEIEAKVSQGSLSLTALTQAQSFFRQEEKEKTPLSTAEKINILTQLENKSSREVSTHLVSLNPDYSPKKLESARPVNSTQSEVKITVDNETLLILKKLQGLLAQKGIRNSKPMTLSEVVTLLAQEGLQRHDPMIKAEKKATKSLSKSSLAPTPAALPVKAQSSISPSPLPAKSAQMPTPALQALTPIEATPQSLSRYIPAAIRDTVWLRDKGQCRFVDPLTIRICQSTYRLQLDHRVPFAMGGQHKVENLRLRCANHNQWHAIQMFGVKKMQRYISQ